ncbi:DUF6530 family protein [Clostridioides mangenotii]|uniref:DUF6530 family protein n=1 Tax=Metaclostridioides mangenotii TaxID=1540 RepID=UPI001C0FEFC7|nr:DUF6530 family protein [Clostridioides mangenotii]MBU5308309.1 hypothetical protein [Clostridioides mangenotii]MCR1953869.1 DUF6530 family protein [Clostridioides mangenotii]
MENKSFSKVIESRNYSNVDGKKAYNSDVESLSIGYSKDENGYLELITRILKDDGSFDELPMNRAIDLAIMICETSLHFRDAYSLPNFYDKDNPVIDRIGMQGDAMTVSICDSNCDIDIDVKVLHDELNKQGELIGERFRTLSRLLNELGY